MAVAGISMGSAIMGQRAAAKEADRKRAAEILSAQLQYSATESSVNLMKNSSREQTGNVIQEALRVGAANDRKVGQQVQQVVSKVVAQSEGLTSGRSKGRQMISLYMKGNEALQESKSKTTSMVNQLADKQDQYTNDLNNKLLSAHQQMASVLTTPGNIYQGNNMAILQAGVQGAATGASLGNSFSSFGGASAGAASYTGIEGRVGGNSGIGG